MLTIESYEPAYEQLLHLENAFLQYEASLPKIHAEVRDVPAFSVSEGVISAHVQGSL